MPKLKTHKGAKKRLKLTKKGKVKRSKAFGSHLMSGKTGKRKRQLRRKVTAEGGEAAKLLRLLGQR